MAFARVTNAASWAVSRSAAGTGLIESLSIADDRDTRLRGLRVGAGDEMYSLADFPATARLMRAGSGSFFVRRGDPDADAAEASLLEVMGREARGGGGGERPAGHLAGRALRRRRSRRHWRRPSTS